MKLLNTITGIFLFIFCLIKTWEAKLNYDKISFITTYAKETETGLELMDPAGKTNNALLFTIVFLVTFLTWLFVNLKKIEKVKPIVTVILIILMFICYFYEATEVSFYLHDIQIGDKPLE